MFIRMIRHFIGPNKEQLEELSLVDSETLLPAELNEEEAKTEPSILFFGTAYVGMVGMDEHGNKVPMQPQPITFQINAKTRSEAFQKFEDSAKEYLRAMKEESERAQQKGDLYIPSAAEMGQLTKHLKLVE